MADCVMLSAFARSHTQTSASKRTNKILILVESPNTLNSSDKSYNSVSAGIFSLTIFSRFSWMQSSSQQSAALFSDIYIPPIKPFYTATKLTSLPGTYISFFISLPSRSSAILASALAAARTSSLGISTGMVSFERTLPIT